ncbi:hypothetical protein [Gracilibacillus alcaliphilus]|uniref:hypothetical protein n=1 Tax=Gracilibacillus alcaliphilus TaxID=1401441 RepID=UPI001958FE98|nr:hypothetical protein [Gracilibacillus alcaliphilus]MBM7675551.1 hypothetical protein [Gracilibacillus alcaliphilus]
MEKESFYSDRVKTIILTVLFIFALFVIFTQILNDTRHLTDTAITFIWILAVVSIFGMLACLFKTFDLRPIIEFDAEGIHVLTYGFIHHFVPWNEIVAVDNHKQKAGVSQVRVTTSFFRIFRKDKRTVSVNLTLLNKQGDRFERVIAKYFN